MVRLAAARAQQGVMHAQAATPMCLEQAHRSARATFGPMVACTTIIALGPSIVTAKEAVGDIALRPRERIASVVRLAAARAQRGLLHVQAAQRPHLEQAHRSAGAICGQPVASITSSKIALAGPCFLATNVCRAVGGTLRPREHTGGTVSSRDSQQHVRSRASCTCKPQRPCAGGSRTGAHVPLLVRW